MSGASKSAQSLLVGGFISKAITFSGTLVLARILMPEDFGYFVVVSIITGFLTMFSISGYETYYIQKRDITDEEDREVLGSVFRLRAIQSAILFALHLAVGIYFLFYRDPITGNMLIITSFIHLFWIIGKPAEAHYSKNLNFKPIVKANIGRDIFSVLLKIGGGLAGLGPYALALGVVGGNLYRQLSISLQAKLNIKFKKNVAYTKAAITFGRSELINGLGNYLKSYSDRIILASFYTKTQIGIFDFAKGQAESVNVFFLYPQIGLVLSYLSKHKNNPERLKEIFKSMGVIIGSLIIPILLYLFFASDFLVPFILGEKWSGSVVFLKVFIIHAIVTLIIFPSSAILTSIGKPHIKTKITIVFTMISIAVLSYMAYLQLSLLNFAVVFVAFNVLSDTVLCVVAVRKIEITFIDYIKYKIGYTVFLIWVVFIGGFILIKYLSPNSIYIITSFYIIVTILNLKFITNNRILDALKIFFGSTHKVTHIAQRLLMTKIT